MTARAQHGSIEVPEVGSIPALVELDAERATAMLLVHPLRALDDVVGAQVGIDVTTNRGLLHVDARVAGVGAGDVLELEGAGDREVIQRRDYARVDAVLEAAVAPPGAAEKLAAVVVNISGSGAVVSRLDDLAPGDPVEIELQLAPGEPPITICGRVVREMNDQLRAIHFEELTRSDRERIVHFVFERQRLELQRLKGR